MMVKVITIMDDVYAELYQLKKAKGMSFSEVLRYLLNQKGERGRSILALGGSVTEFDVDKKKMERIKYRLGGG